MLKRLKFILLVAILVTIPTFDSLATPPVTKAENVNVTNVPFQEFAFTQTAPKKDTSPPPHEAAVMPVKETPHVQAHPGPGTNTTHSSPPAGQPETGKPPEAKPPEQHGPVSPAQPASTDGQPASTQPDHSVKPPEPSSPEDEKVAYLTFDDGPSHVTTKILDILKQEQIHATFFLVGHHVKKHDEIVKRMVAEGHVIGGHTYSHDYRIIYKNAAAFFQDLENGNMVIQQVSGVAPTVFRYPGGSTNTVSRNYQDPSLYTRQHSVMTEIIRESKKRGYTFIDWNVTVGDARPGGYTAASAIQNVKHQVKNQRQIVVLMHDSAGKMPTAESLPEIIRFLREKGYVFRTIQQDASIVSVVK